MISTTDMKENSNVVRNKNNLTSANSDESLKDTAVMYPMTPSPPNKMRRSSTSMGFLATPKFTSSTHDELGFSHSKLNSKRTSISGVGMDNESSDDDEHINPSLAMSPSYKSRLLPPTTPKSRNMETYMSPSPKLTSPGIYKESTKPIREISNNLKTRLNYAFVKMQNGWTDKTLSELDQELDRQQRALNLQQQLSPSHFASGSYRNSFASADSDQIGDVLDAKHKLNLKSSFSSQNNEADDNANSARTAFMKALSSPSKGQGQSASISPLKWSNTTIRKAPANKKKKKTGNGKDGATEVAAVETLMSLSSPKKSKSSKSLDNTSNHASDNDTEVDISDE